MWLYHLTHSMRPIVGLYWRFRLVGEVDRVPRNGPLVVAMNHVSYLKFLGMVFPRPLRYLITRDWYDKSAFWRWFFDANGTLPVGNDPETTSLRLLQSLDRGEAIGFFPEGRISHDGRIQRFRSGIAYIAARSGAPVVPLGIQGAFESLPRQRRFPKPGPVTVHVGEPLVFPAAPHEGDLSRDQLVAFRRELYRRVGELSGQQDRVAVAVRRRSVEVARVAKERPNLSSLKRVKEGILPSSTSQA